MNEEPLKALWAALGAFLVALLGAFVFNWRLPHEDLASLLAVPVWVGGVIAAAAFIAIAVNRYFRVAANRWRIPIAVVTFVFALVAILLVIAYLSDVLWV